MELRRALLLFAIVLGLAAIVTSVSTPRDEGGDTAPAAPGAAADSPAGEVAQLRFSAKGAPATERLAAGSPAEVRVEVEEAGQVELAGLGLVAAAEPLTPARFDVLTVEEGIHPVRFTKAGANEARTIGTLQVVPAESR